jgi:hypothetical protein
MSTAFVNSRQLNNLSFAITDSKEFIPSCPPPLITLPRKTPVTVVDIPTIWPDHHYLHYENRFHDSTVNALRTSDEPIVEVLHGVRFVSDRKSLRRLVVNNCLSLPPNSFYCKKDSFTLMAEKINGTIFLGGETRYEPAAGSYGQGFEELLTQRFHRGNVANITTNYCMVQYSLMNKVNCIVRYEADGINSEGDVEELKCKKKPNPRYGLSEDYFLNMWIQMALSRTTRVHIGLHRDGRVDEIMSLSLDQVQQRANLSTEAANRCWSSLQKMLERLYDRIPEGSQARINCEANGTVTIVPSSALPLLSSNARRVLSAAPSPIQTETESTGSPNAAEAAATTPAAVLTTAVLPTPPDVPDPVNDLASVFQRAASLAK